MTAERVVYIIVERNSTASMTAFRTMMSPCQDESNMPAAVDRVPDDHLDLSRTDRGNFRLELIATSDYGAALEYAMAAMLVWMAKLERCDQGVTAVVFV